MSTSPVAQLIAGEIARRGRITFRDYMALALYDPESGYYARAEPRIGPEGDYYTSPDLHAGFGWCIARQLEQMWRLLGAPARFDLVELGGGKGLLARDILTWADAEAADFGRALRYTSLEISPAMRARQRALLRDQPAQRVRWAAADDLPPESVVGCILANEFFDALPVHRVRIDRGEPRELYVGLDPAGDPPRFVEELGPLSTPAIARCLEALGRPADGSALEVNLEALDWAAWSAVRLARGHTLWIDYGDTHRALASAERRRGTLRTYRRHTAGCDPYVEPGDRDLTSHVDFTALAWAGRTHGLEFAGYTRQSHFLAALGLGDLLARRLAAPDTTLADYRRDRRAIEALIHPGGLGAFRVLAMRKAAPPAPLQGFSLLDEGEP